MSEPMTSAGERPFYGKPFLWVLFGLVLFAIPAVGYMVQSGWAWEEMHPALNAMFNGSASVFLIAGYFAIRRRRIAFHRQCMIAAFTASSLFLVSYLARYAMSGSHKYPGAGWDKGLYFAILFSHMLLAVVLLPMALRTLYLGLKDRRPKHRRIARWTLPVWLYVSVTGVLVYLMLYPIAEAIYGP